MPSPRLNEINYSNLEHGDIYSTQKFSSSDKRRKFNSICKIICSIVTLLAIGLISFGIYLYSTFKYPGKLILLYFIVHFKFLMFYNINYRI